MLILKEHKKGMKKQYVYAIACYDGKIRTPACLGLSSVEAKTKLKTKNEAKDTTFCHCCGRAGHYIIKLLVKGKK